MSPDAGCGSELPLPPPQAVSKNTIISREYFVSNMDWTY